MIEIHSKYVKKHIDYILDLKQII